MGHWVIWAIGVIGLIEVIGVIGVIWVIWVIWVTGVIGVIGVNGVNRVIVVIEAIGLIGVMWGEDAMVRRKIEFAVFFDSQYRRNEIAPRSPLGAPERGLLFSSIGYSCKFSSILFVVEMKELENVNNLKFGPVVPFEQNFFLKSCLKTNIGGREGTELTTRAPWEGIFVLFN